MTPRPSGAVRRRSATSSCGSPKNSFPPPVSSPTSERRRTPTVCGESPPMPFELGASGVGVEEGQQRAQVGEVEEREAFLVGVVEDEPEALLLRRVRAEHLREEKRPEVGDRGAHRHSRADPAEREVLDREARRRERKAELGGALLRGAVVRSGQRHPGDVALHVGREDGDARGRELLGDQLQRSGLPRPRRPRDQAVPVHRREREPDGRLGHERAREHAGAELDRAALRRVRGGDRGAERRSVGRRPGHGARSYQRLGWIHIHGILDPKYANIWCLTTLLLGYLGSNQVEICTQSSREAARWAQVTRTGAGRGSRGRTRRTTSSGSAGASTSSTRSRGSARSGSGSSSTRGLRRRARRAHRRPGRADGQGRPEGDLPLRLAGRGRREPRRAHVPRPEPVPGEQRAGAREADQQRAAPRRPDRLRRGQERHATGSRRSSPTPRPASAGR